jgi:hypothetical protein
MSVTACFTFHNERSMLGARISADRRGNQYLKAPSLKSAESADLRVTGMPSRLDSYSALLRQLLDTA